MIDVLTILVAKENANMVTINYLLSDHLKRSANTIHVIKDMNIIDIYLLNTNIIFVSIIFIQLKILMMILHLLVDLIVMLIIR